MPHIHKQIDFTSEVFIVFKDKVLLRKHDKYNLWLGVGGHIELSEDPNQAAIREVKEEVGLDITLYDPNPFPKSIQKFEKELIPPVFMNRHFISKDHEHVTMIFFGISHTDKLMLSATEVSESCNWFTHEELMSRDFDIRPNIRHYALSALKALAPRKP
jgi:8-oxo-dGTP pyrophosphatase MutT (NUDIX family)